MIDFHTHILPEVDDGSRSIEETFNLIKEANEAGFNSIISTSHYIEGYWEVNTEERKTWITRLSTKLKENNINIELFLGSEIYFSENIIQLLEKGKASTINNSNYVLFELPFNLKFINLYNVIYELLEHKFIPILAHPERYNYVIKEPEIIFDLIKRGVLIQSNYGSVIGQYGGKAKVMVKKMLQNDMVHFLGTDVHKENTIYLSINKILYEIENLVGKNKLDLITKINPKLVLQNKKIEICEPTKIEFTFKEKLSMMRK